MPVLRSNAKGDDLARMPHFTCSDAQAVLVSDMEGSRGTNVHATDFGKREISDGAFE